MTQNTIQKQIDNFKLYDYQPMVDMLLLNLENKDNPELQEVIAKIRANENDYSYTKEAKLYDELFSILGNHAIELLQKN